MNKYNESIEFIRNRIYHLETSFKGHADLSYLDNVILPPIRELVERATPKEYVIKEIGKGRHKGLIFLSCKCGYGSIVEGDKHCGNCGQALDWEATLSNDKTL